MEIVHLIETACLWEAEAPKAGNVHPQASFEDLSYDDFLRSSRITAFMLSQVRSRGVSQSILNTVRAVQLQVGKNTNLGIVLLFGPIIAVEQNKTLEQGLSEIIDGLGVEDCCLIYQAIQIANPGGMSQIDNQDINAVPTQNVRSVMRLAQDYDMIARQYANNFQDILGFGLERLAYWWTEAQGDRKQAVVGLHLDWMAQYPDSLIMRKCGKEVANEAATRSADVLKSGWPKTEISQKKFVELDRWLRSDGNKKNPGTSADLVAGCLLAGLREGIIS